MRLDLNFFIGWLGQISRWCCFYLVCASTVFAQIHTIQSIPDPKKSGSGFVSNPDGVLRPEEVQTLNALLTQLETVHQVQMAVVAVNSIGTAVPRPFATELFNTWKIGDEKLDTGLLLLVVLDQKRWEFETGYGLEPSLPDAVLGRIGDQHLIPHFKQKAYGQGILEAVSAINERLIAQKADPNGFVNERETSNAQNQAQSRTWWMMGIIAILQFLTFGIFALGRGKWAVMVFAAGIIATFVGVGLYAHQASLSFTPTQTWLILSLLASHSGLAAYRIRRNRQIRETYIDAYDRFIAHRNEHTFIWWLCCILAPLFFVGYAIWYLIWETRQRSRFKQRFGKDNQPLSRVKEPEEDRYLAAGQQTEERVQSIDYDVWINEAGEAEAILPYPSFASGYQTCPKCSYKTFHQTSDRTLISASTSSSGIGERSYECEHCSHRKTERYTIAKLSSSSSSGGSSSGGSSSWGGGSSGGGGAGGSW